MPLYNLKSNRELSLKSEKDKRSIADSQVVHILHDREVEIEETIEGSNVWDPFRCQIYGFLDGSKNPPFPEAEGGQIYIIDGKGTVGGVEVEDHEWIMCIKKYSPEGFTEDIKKNWVFSGKRVTIYNGGGGSGDGLFWIGEDEEAVPETNITWIPAEE